MSDERRAYQRLTLVEPLDGWFGDFPVRLIDVSASGAQIEHEETIPDDARALLRFFWRNQEVEILAETARTIQTHRAGVRFLEDNDVLRTLLANSTADVIRALEANARGDRAQNVIGEETLTSAWRRPASGFVQWIFDEDGGWRAVPSDDRDQPENGFTISAAEEDDQVEMLCDDYRRMDGETKQLIRLLARITVEDAE